MKMFLIAAMLISGSAFARGSDYDWACRVTAMTRGGQWVRYTTKPMSGVGLGGAQLNAIRDCKAAGYLSCRASCYQAN